MAQEKLRELLWTGEDFWAEIIPKLKQVMRLDDKGNAYFLVPYASLSDSQKLGLHLMAQYFARQLKVVDSEYLTIKELAQRSGLKEKTARARLSEMFDAGIVTKTKEKGTRYSIFPHGITMIVEDVLKVKTDLTRKSGG